MPRWTPEQMEAINEEGKNIIVSAGAGSGKTAVLTERVIRKLKSGVNVDELLILTFTNAAAFEMKERIRSAIKKEESLVKQLDLIDGAYITTFDSYALSMVKKYHYLLNISNRVDIIDSSILYLEKNKILDQIFDRLYQEHNPLFEKLINDFCVKDDKDIKKSILTISDKLDLKYDKKEYLDTYIDTFYSKDNINKYISEYTNILINQINNIKNSYNDLLLYVDEKFDDELRDQINKLFDSKTYEEIVESSNITLPRVNKNCNELAKDFKEILSANLKELVGMIEFKTTNELENTYLLTKDYVSIIIDIIKELDIKITNYKNIYNAYEFTDISKMAIKILDENESIREELKYSFNEIMVDEYQDTSDLQETFIKFIENDNVYMVGDIKQSIYRFRNANPDIFKTKYENYSKEIGGHKIDLVKNFRSREEVLNNINLIFDSIMDSYIGGADYQVSHRMVFGNTAYVELGTTSDSHDMEFYNYKFEKIGYSKEEIEAFIIASDIKEKVNSHYQVFDKSNGIKRDITYSDFVILLDRSTAFDLYKQIFEYMNIPLVKYTSTNVTTSNDILLIKNIIGLIIDVYNKNYSTSFKYHFMSVGRSFLFNMSDNTLLECITNNNYSSELLTKVKNIVKDLETLSLTSLIKRIYDDFNFLEKEITVGYIESAKMRLEYLYQITSNLESMGKTIFDFYEYLDKVIEDNLKMECNMSDEGSNSVKIMTIHKSKGLEYHICYFASLHKEFNLMELKDKFLYDNNYGIITPFIMDGVGELFLKKLLKKKVLEAEISEKIRLFYVALTRAKEKMIFVTDLGDEIDNYYDDSSIVINSVRLKYKSFLGLMRSILSKIKDYEKVIDLSSITLSKNYKIIGDMELSSLKDNSNPIIKKEVEINSNLIKCEHYSKNVINVFTKEEVKNIELGLKLHNYLEHIDFNNPILPSNDYYMKKIEAFLNCGLDFKNAKIYKEFEFIKDNHHGIIDLILEYDNEILIIDYKLKHIIDKSYLKQLEGYKEYIKSIKNKPIKLYLYSILDEKLEEITA